MTARIIIAEYDPRWPVIYENEARAIRDALDDRLAAIEHVGSTAVPGLAAKPVIDIMPGVARASDLDRCVSPLVGLGYEYVPRYEASLPRRRYFRKRPPGSSSAFHVHVVERGSEFWDRHLLFRDYLRAHPDVAREYERLKRELAPQFTDSNAYAEAKTDFIRSVENRARADIRYTP